MVFIDLLYARVVGFELAPLHLDRWEEKKFSTTSLFNSPPSTLAPGCLCNMSLMVASNPRTVQLRSSKASRVMNVLTKQSSMRSNIHTNYNTQTQTFHNHICQLNNWKVVFYLETRAEVICCTKLIASSSCKKLLRCTVFWPYAVSYLASTLDRLYQSWKKASASLFWSKRISSLAM